MKYRFDQIGSDFKCIHCRHIVSTDPILSGVSNRNHCPYCLHSRHLDLSEAGDRLSACKAEMQPVGLTFKRTNKKYGKAQGELMIIHLCAECGSVSINRIAADDDAETLYKTFERSLQLASQVKAQIAQRGIQVLQAADAEHVQAQLYGWNAYRQQELSYA